jgi:hypothetical protein
VGIRTLKRKAKNELGFVVGAVVVVVGVVVVVVSVVVVLVVVVFAGGPGGWQPAQSVNVSTQKNKLRNLTLIVISERRLKIRIYTNFYRCFWFFETTLILRNNKTIRQVKAVIRYAGPKGWTQASRCGNTFAFDKAKKYIQLYSAIAVLATCPQTQGYWKNPTFPH